MHAFNLEDIGKQKGHCKDKVEGKPVVGKSNISEQEIKKKKFKLSELISELQLPMMTSFSPVTSNLAADTAGVWGFRYCWPVN